MDNDNRLEIYSRPEIRVYEHIQNLFEAANTRR
jgi:hypothetical protein